MKYVSPFTQFKTAVFVLTLFVSMSHAEVRNVSPPPANAVTISDLVAMALRDNPLLRSENARIEEKTLAGLQTKKWPGPTVEFSAGRRRNPDQSGPLYNADVSQPLFLFGKQGLRGDLSYLESESWRTRLEASENQITLDVVQLAVEVSVKRRDIHFVEKRRERLTLIQSFLEGRLFASPQKKAESRIVQSRLKTLFSDNLQSQAAFKVSYEKLRRFVPMETGAPPHIQVPWFTGKKDLDQNEWTKKALAMNPDLRLQAISVKSAEKEKQLAVKEKLPDPALIASYERGTAAETETNSNMGLSLSLPFWNRNQAGIKSAEKRHAAEVGLLSDQERIVKAQIPEVFAEYEAARRAVQEYPEELLRELQAQMEEAEAGFRKGQVDLLTFLEMDGTTAETYRHVLESQLGLLTEVTKIFRLSGERNILSQLETF